MKYVLWVVLRVAILAAAGSSLVNVAYADQDCFGGGYIKAVATNYWAFDWNGVVGIQVLHDDGLTRNYSTLGFGDLDSVRVRALLQEATAAFIAQSHVWVQVTGSCTDSQRLGDSRNWIRNWSGLWMQ
ncbi:MAG TPA: hypothetical protein VJB68_01330 [Methylophilaceae bacterium]|nr:hypothetical protein [Methylophilaceae bacterium]